MSTKILPIRKHIHDCLKNFPWTSDTQFEAIWIYVDHQLAGRGRGRQALLRAGMSDFSDRILEYQYFVTMGEGDLYEISKGKDLNVEKSNW